MFEVDLFVSANWTAPKWELAISRQVLQDEINMSWKARFRYFLEGFQRIQVCLVRPNKQRKNQVPESGASGTPTFAGDDLKSCTTQETLHIIGLRHISAMNLFWSSMVQNCAVISWKAIVKGTGILGACFPDVEHRCFPNSYGYIISLALSLCCRLVTFFYPG